MNRCGPQKLLLQAQAKERHLNWVLVVEVQSCGEVLQLGQVVDVARAVFVVFMLPELRIIACFDEPAFAANCA